MAGRTRRIAVIGAGPIGLEAALYAARAGYDVQVYEQGPVAGHVAAWGHVTLFSPFGMNSSAWGRQALSRDPSSPPLPADEALLTGHEFIERYLLPLSRLPALAGRIHEHVSVDAVARQRHWKGDLIGRPARGDDRFQLLLRDRNGERVERADVILDCSGTFGHHNWIGAGGMPCVGERQWLSTRDYLLPDISGARRPEFLGRRTLVVGSGYSAATAIVALAQLAEDDPATRAVWVTRTGRTPPIAAIENDSLPQRAHLAAAVNELALSKCGPVEWLPGRRIGRIEGPSQQDAAPRTVYFAGGEEPASGEGDECRTVERIITNVGYRPNRRLYEELQVHECYASSGPMKLAAALLGETSADCTNQTSRGAETLRNPEPNLFILGSKSYGRDSRFLLRIGHEQIVDAFTLIP